jgi:putative endonuclease
MQEVVGSTPILSTNIISCFGRIFLFMSFFVYILYSSSLDRYYIGHTENLEDRIFRHTNSGSRSTKKANDWVVKYTKEFGLRGEAMGRELKSKVKKVENILSG